jgi:hypothetical protein
MTCLMQMSRSRDAGVRARTIFLAVALHLVAVPLAQADSVGTSTVFLVQVAPALKQTFASGRLFVFVSRNNQGEPRLFDSSSWYSNTPALNVPVLFGTDVTDVAPGRAVTLDGKALGYPVASLRAMPEGDYAVQAVLVPYTRFARADGHVIFAHDDHGEGQDVLNSPGNLVSQPVHVHLDARSGFKVPLTLDRALPPLAAIHDTEFVKHLHFRSELASTFWGKEMQVGISVSLPKGYAEHPQRRYPVVFHQGHFGEGAVFSMLEAPRFLHGEHLAAWEAYAGSFREDWKAGRVPQLIIVTLQHATPYYDTSYFMNSPNTGPWADVFIKEVVPFVEAHFRTIAKPYARVFAGLSSGGGISAYLQVHYPELFGGAWIFAPDPVDFHDFYTVDLYSDPSAYAAPGFTWEMAPARCEFRTTQGQCLQTMRDLTRYFDVLGSHGRSGQWLDNYDALYGPVGPDGYPVPVWNHQSGEIDAKVVAYWREHGADLREYLAANWARLAPALEDKLHFAAGDMDNFFLNNGIYLMQDFLAKQPTPAINASFKIGHPKIGHTYVGVGYDPFPTGLLEDMARHIASHAPLEDRSLPWLQP